MKTICLRCLFLLLLTPLTTLAAAGTTVVMISIDGLAADYLDDPRADLPTLRRMAQEGARAKRMQGVFPTVTWPNHTSMVTGVMPARHGVVSNRYYDRTADRAVDLLWDPLLDKEDLVLAPTIYDVAHRAGLKTAGVAWPASRNARHLDWQVPCVIDPELLARYSTPALLAELSEQGIVLAKKAEWEKLEVGGKLLWDWMHTRVAQHILRKHQPNLLLLHFDAVDAAQHRHGRNSAEAYWAANIADHYLAELVETVRSAGLAARTTFFVVSDHGFRNYSRQIHLNALLREAGFIKTAGNRIVEGRVQLIVSGGSAGLYVTGGSDRAAVVSDLLARLRQVEGVEKVLGPDEVAAQGLPAPGPSSRSPDIMISAADGYSFSARIPGEDVVTPAGSVKGVHGALPAAPEMQALFIASGPAIKRGVTLQQIRNVDVAPTLAAVLGVAWPETDGRAISEILR